MSESEVLKHRDETSLSQLVNDHGNGHLAKKISGTE